MEKHKNSSVWTEEGYRLFATEGLDGIQVERLARILRLNKSGFYHYFGDLDNFCAELVSLHKKKVGDFLHEVAVIKKLDPDYLHLLIKYAVTVMFQVHLTQHQPNHFFYKASEWIDQRVNIAVRKLWSDFMDASGDSDLGMRYYAIVRDMFYTRISFQNLNYTFLHNLVTDAKAIMNEISEHKALETDGPFY
jgi:AcrR family transcriptional regulator